LKPRGTFVKVNVDAAFIAEEGNGATGVIIRNSQGMFLSGWIAVYTACGLCIHV
jgi:hypothetical protein